MCRAQKDLVWGILGWLVMFIFGLGCVFVAQGANTGAWLSMYWLQILWGVCLFSLPLGLVGVFFFWKARVGLSSNSTFIPRDTMFIWAASPVLLGIPFLFFLSYIVDTSRQGLAVTGERLMFFGMLGLALYFIPLLGLSLIWSMNKRMRQ